MKTFCALCGCLINHSAMSGLWFSSRKLLSYLQRVGTAMEAHIIEAGVIQGILVFLHLGLDATDSSILTLLAPVAVLSPLHAGALQRRVAAAAELDVVDGRVVTEQTLMGLHVDLERGEHTTGAVLGLGPVTEAGQESRKYMRVRRGKKIRTRAKLWAGNNWRDVKTFQHLNT